MANEVRGGPTTTAPSSSLGILSQVAAASSSSSATHDSFPPSPPPPPPPLPAIPATSVPPPPSAHHGGVTNTLPRLDFLTSTTVDHASSLASTTTASALDPALSAYLQGGLTPSSPNLALPGDTYAGLDYSNSFPIASSSSSSSNIFNESNMPRLAVAVDTNSVGSLNASSTVRPTNLDQDHQPNHPEPADSDSSISDDDDSTNDDDDDEDDDLDVAAGSVLGDMASKVEALYRLDVGADEVLKANRAYKRSILIQMHKLARAMTRTEELQVLVKDMEVVLEKEPELKVMAPGTTQVTLPWFKHFYNKDLPPNNEGLARDLYLSTIRHIPWTPAERALLKKEIVIHNKREMAMKAIAQRWDPNETVASYDDEYYAASLEFSIDWDKIALVMPRRNPIECKIQWMQNDQPLINRTKWSQGETAKLVQIAETRNCQDWAAICAELGTRRTVADCLKTYRRRIIPKKEWTTEEDDKLKEAVALFGENWQSVARHVGRHSNQCINRWSKSLRPTIKRGKWSSEEDAALKAAIQAVGGLAWKQVAARMNGRTDAQCRERWVNILDPNILPPRQWSDEDEKQLVAWREEEHKTWSEIAVLFQGRRTDNHCMRRYADIVKRRTARPKAADVATNDSTGAATDPAEVAAPSSAAVVKSTKVMPPRKKRDAPDSSSVAPPPAKRGPQPKKRDRPGRPRNPTPPLPNESELDELADPILDPALTGIAGPSPPPSPPQATPLLEPDELLSDVEGKGGGGGRTTRASRRRKVGTGK